MIDYTHLFTLNSRLLGEQSRLAKSTTKKEHEIRSVWVKQIEKEIEGERQFLGLTNSQDQALIDDKLLNELFN